MAALDAIPELIGAVFAGALGAVLLIAGVARFLLMKLPARSATPPIPTATVLRATKRGADVIAPPPDEDPGGPRRR